MCVLARPSRTGVGHPRGTLRWPPRNAWRTPEQEVCFEAARKRCASRDGPPVGGGASASSERPLVLVATPGRRRTHQWHRVPKTRLMATSVEPFEASVWTAHDVAREPIWLATLMLRRPGCRLGDPRTARPGAITPSRAPRGDLGRRSTMAIEWHGDTVGGDTWRVSRVYVEATVIGA
jgi:hypothetical protein